MKTLEQLQGEHPELFKQGAELFEKHKNDLPEEVNKEEINQLLLDIFSEYYYAL